MQRDAVNIYLLKWSFCRPSEGPVREPGSQESQLLLKDTALLSDAPEAASSASKEAHASDTKGDWLRRLFSSLNRPCKSECNTCVICHFLQLMHGFMHGCWVVAYSTSLMTYIRCPHLHESDATSQCIAFRR